MERDSPTADFTVRRYEPGDADAVWTVHEEALRASAIPFVEEAPADADLRAVADEYLDAGGEFLVGEVGDEVVAVGGFRPSDDARGECTDCAAEGDALADRGDAGDAAELRRMRVRPDRQREGYATALVSELEARARNRGFDRMVLETHEDLTAARRFYEARGYERVGTESRPEIGDELVRYHKKL